MRRRMAMSSLPSHRRSMTPQHGAAGALLLLVVVVALAAWWFWPREAVTPVTPAAPAEPRPVAARGALADDEQNNVSVFKNVSPSAVNVTTLELARSFLSLDIF